MLILDIFYLGQVKATGISLVLDLFIVSLADAKYTFGLVLLAGNFESSH